MTFRIEKAVVAYGFVSWDFSSLWDVRHCHIHSEFNQWQIMGKGVGDVVFTFAKLNKSPQRVEVAKTRRLAAWMLTWQRVQPVGLRQLQPVELR